MKSTSIPIKRALLSVSDKSHLVELAHVLNEFGVELISTGGTKKVLEEHGLKVTSVEAVTGNPEAFGGRMKTISFQIESALLYRRGHGEDEQDAKNLNILPIDLVVCNLYPFKAAKEKGASEDELIENIDIGGPTMIRASAKNYESVACVTGPSQYEKLMNELKANQGSLSFDYRRELAVEAFHHSAQYDMMVAEELQRRFKSDQSLYLDFHHGKELRYGENAHQKAHFFDDGKFIGVGQANILQGKALSYNNLLDADASWRCMSDCHHASQFNNNSSMVTVTVVKHLNPCGVACSDSAINALKLAWDCDPVSAFGGILSFSQSVSGECAEFLQDKFVEVIVAPHFDQRALEILGKKKNLRLLELPVKPLVNGEKTVKSIHGGILYQDEDEGLDLELKSVTKLAFPSDKLTLAHFGIMVNKYLKSNSVCLVCETDAGELTIHGAGMGQPNRIDALKKLAAPMARNRSQFDLSKSLLISDAFFPFADSIDVCHQEGIFLVVQPGGSIRDQEVIDACDKYKMSMCFTGTRHFRH